MRELYPIGAMFKAIAAWEKHKADYLAALSAARADAPTEQALGTYRQFFIEAYMEALVDADENTKQ